MGRRPLSTLKKPPKEPASRRNIGAANEALAAQHLQQHGLGLYQRNYHCRYGEIDLIMRNDKEWVFVEVRSRSRSLFASPLESIGPQKQRRLLITAEHFLAQQSSDQQSCRFAVVAVLLHPGGRSEIEWLPNAFGA